MIHISNPLKMLFATPEQRLVLAAKNAAIKTNHSFYLLQNIILDGEVALHHQNKTSQDREKFIKDNEGFQVDQNVDRNTDNKLALKLLASTFVFEAILSFKGTQYLADTFSGITFGWLILIAGLAFASFAIFGSIILNHLGNSITGKYSFLKYFIIPFSFAMIFIIPTCNLIETYEASSSKQVILLNWVLVFITVGFHISLILLSRTFLTAIKSKIAIRQLKQKEKVQENADNRIRIVNRSFLKGRSDFSNSSKEFIIQFNSLKRSNAETAQLILYYLDNFTIWMINNKVMQHAVLQYHSNENGQPVVELKYFTSENDAIRQGWDRLSTFKKYNASEQSKDQLTDHIESDQSAGTNQPEQTQPETNIIDTGDQEANPGTQEQPKDYDSILNDVEPSVNDKTL